MHELDLDRLANIDNEWQEIESSYRLAPYTAPINLLEEKHAVLSHYAAGKSYNPQFEYANPPDFPIRRIQKFLRTLDPELSCFEQVYYELGYNELLKIRAVQTHSPSLITGHTSLIYGIPSSSLIQSAKSILEESDPQDPDSFPQSERISASDAAAEIQRALEKTNLEDWKAEVFSPMNAKVSVNRRDNLVKIRGDAVFSTRDLRRLLVHEIGVHVFRAHNGRGQPISILGRGLPGYLETEEGLAVYSEEKAGVIAVSTMRKYASRVIAAAVALSHSFDEVFHTVVKNVDQDTAFEIAARAKRGFYDTAEPGAHTKDIVYLKGYLEVSQYLEAHPEDYEMMFIGKIGLSDIGLMKSLAEAGILKTEVFTPAALEYEGALEQ